MEKSSKKLFAEIAAAVATTAITVGPPVATKIIYEKMFGHHITTYDPHYFYLEDFPGLKREHHEFLSDRGQKLVGYVYYREGIEKTGLVVLSHGYGGGGQRTYMDCTNYLCLNGFYVFAYDATANDESEGDVIGGFPQGIIDLNHAINYISSVKQYKNYPMVLFGHSWGAYSACNALKENHNIKAVVALSGFNNSAEFLRMRGEGYGGNSAASMYPYISNHEQARFGKYAGYSAMNAFASCSTPVFIVHSGDDDVVPYTAGYKIYYEKYKNDPRFTFMLYEKRGHGTVYYNEEGINYTKAFEAKLDKFNKEKHTDEERLDFYNKNLDRSIWANRVDKELFKRIIDFYKANI
ncbi:MAG: lysophospholipase, partial [Bacilli bacterium]|nr:lysophospholipase [Bacilli bacterium]